MNTERIDDGLHDSLVDQGLITDAEARALDDPTAARKLQDALCELGLLGAYLEILNLEDIVGEN